MCALNISIVLKILQENCSLKEKHRKQTIICIKLVIHAEHPDNSLLLPPNLISFQGEG